MSLTKFKKNKKEEKKSKDKPKEEIKTNDNKESEEVIKEIGKAKEKISFNKPKVIVKTEEKTKEPEKIKKKPEKINLLQKVQTEAKQIIQERNPNSKTITLLNPNGETWIMGLTGPAGTGKTKRSQDLVSLLGPDEWMLVLDSEFKADKMKARWHQDERIEIVNFQQVDPETYDTKEIESIDMFREVFQKDWKTRIESKKYKIVVIDKANPFWSWAKDYYKSLDPKRFGSGKSKIMQYEYGEVYDIVLKKIFNPLINCCRINNTNLIICANVKGEYFDEKEVRKKPNLHDAIIDALDYSFWVMTDYEVYCLKNEVKAWWTTMDEDVNFAEYFNSKEFIIDGKEISEITREFKRYEDFMEDVRSTTQQRNVHKEERKKINLK